ncbi:outer membrane lipoprotein chaperone LolA [Paucibacter soli]|uniref:outer membrane lipoprotein chaperone LolA n=1 Tax=Paucibacter soli TaxID=3133433 RepID=UPI0030A5765B
MRATKTLLGAALLLAGLAARADAIAALNEFASAAKSGRAVFTQTVLSPDGKRKKSSSGTFEFQRPNQFRFAYLKPFEQLIVGDGQKVWLFDPDLNQASSRRMSQALGATPAALLAGGQIGRDFEFKLLPNERGLEWVQALPRQSDGSIQALKLGFRGKELAALELVDGFGQRSQLEFSELQLNVKLAAERFRFVLPAGADLVEQ